MANGGSVRGAAVEGGLCSAKGSETGWRTLAMGETSVYSARKISPSFPAPSGYPVRSRACLRSPGLAAVAAFSGLLIAACGDGEITGTSASVDVRPYVTGAAAASLDADHLFTFPEPAAPSTKAIVSPERARDIAMAVVRSWGPTARYWWDKDRGEPVDPATLQPDGRAFYALPPYELFPEGYHPAFPRFVGPYYLVRMRSGSEYPVVVAVSAYSTEVRITENGLIERPADRGGEFLDKALAADTTREYWAFLSPEEAVARAAQHTGARISEVPQLVLSQANMGPVGGALWKLTLERPVRVRAAESGRTVDVTEVYVGRKRARELLIPAVQQPTEVTVSAMRAGGGEQVWDNVQLRLRPGVPLNFEVVVPVSP